MTVKTRMAPSPTGEYHIGHIRTLLYNWAFARKNKGKFLIRIEDTDRERLVKGATERILDVISDYGFDWDEGPRVGGPHEPYIQSKRLEVYKKHIDILLKKKAAYCCFCTTERLNKMRDEQKKAGVASTKYDRKCLTLSKDQVEKNLKEKMPHVVRLKIPDNRKVTFTDQVYGKLSFESKEIDDQVLLKSDGFPTYHLAVVVDDHLMKITHVMRGNDWLPSTPKHILLYEAFGWEKPVYIHLPNLKELGAHKKLSKRFGPVTAREFLDKGYLPEALINFLMFLGWNPGTEKEIYALDEFTNDFSIDKIHKTDLVAFDRKKLDWMNQQYLIKKRPEEFVTYVSAGSVYRDEPEFQQVARGTASELHTRVGSITDYDEYVAPIFRGIKQDRNLFGSNYKKHLKSAIEVLGEVDEKRWEKENINEILNRVVKDKGFKTGDFFMDLRIALTGKKVTMPIHSLIGELGRTITLKRLGELIK